jgi:hypothetical protein
MVIRKTASVHGVLATLGGLALALGATACSTGGTTAPEPAATTASATVQTPAAGSAALVRLSNAQYDNAVRELLGVPGLTQTTLPSDSLGDGHFEQYFNAADALGEQVFADPFLTSRLLICTPSQEMECTRQIVASFGARAWRGPMAPADVDRLTKLAADAVALGETPVNSIKQVVKTVLASPQFLYTVGPTTTL